MKKIYWCNKCFKKNLSENEECNCKHVGDSCIVCREDQKGENKK